MTYPNLNKVVVKFIARALDAGQPKPWILNAISRAPERPQLHDLLKRLDSLIAVLSPQERDDVKARIHEIGPKNPKQWREEYDEQFREVLIELLGWKWLRERHPGKKVRLYPRSSKKAERTPDLGIWDGENLIGAMECKKVNFSEEEKAWLRSEPGTMKSGTLSVENNLRPSSSFAKKLVGTIQGAKGQLDSMLLRDNKFIFVSISLDTPFWSGPLTPSVQQFLRELACSLSAEGVRLIIFEGYQSDQSFI